MAVALSPDGSKVVYVGAYRAGGRAVMVADLKTGTSAVVMSSTDLRLTPERCQFKSQTRLVCTVGGILTSGRQPIGFTRMIAVDTDGKNAKMIGQYGYNADRTFYGGRVVDWLPDDPAHVLMAVSNEADMLNIGEDGLGVARVDIRSGVRTVVERAGSFVAQLGSDNNGAIRFRASVERNPGGYNRDTVSYYVRPKGSRDWKLLLRATLSDQTAPRFVGFDETGDYIYQLKLLDGRQALYRVAADGSNTATLVYAHPAVDVDGVLRIGKFRRPVAATFAVERDESHFFDTKLAAIGNSLSRALPGHPDVNILDESWDGQKKLVYVDGDNIPGRYFLYDTTTRKLGELLAVFPGLDGVTLGQVKAVRYAARDGTMIPAYLTLPPGRADAKGLPAIVMPHGGPSARDTSGFDWLPQFFAASGYAVLQPNFRGSTGYGADFFAKNGFQSWALAVGDINDGARWLVSQGAEAKQLAIVGWSYGGYAALQANVVEPGLYRATVAVAPVTDLELLRQEALDYSNYKQIDAMIGKGPHVVAGSPARNAAKIMTPVLMFSGDKDQNVDIEQARTMASALRRAGKSVQLIEYKGLNHGLDDSEARRDMLAKSAAFLSAAIK